MKSQYLIILCYLVFAYTGYGQQEIILTKYTVNSLFFNPGYAGSHGLGEGSVVFQYRRQWLNLEGSPRTIIVGMEGSAFEDRVGLGLSIGQEKIGIDSRTDLYSNYAYRIKTLDGTLAFGLRFGASLYRADFSAIQNIELNDVVYDRPNLSLNVLNAGVGAYYREEKFYLGLAAPTIVSIGSNKGSSLKSRHYYLHTGILLGGDYNDFMFEPSLLVKSQKSVPFQFTLGCSVWYKEFIALGISWRSEDAIAAIAELIIDNQFKFALAYDFTISDIRTISAGSPEVMIGYHFNYLPSNKKIRNIRHRGNF